jgi:hypothetical protein
VRPVIGRPYRWGAETTAVSVRSCAPDFGEAAGWVLEGLLGLEPARASALREAGVVTGAPVAAAAVAPLDLAVMLRTGALARVDEDYRAVLAGATGGPPCAVKTMDEAAASPPAMKVRSG